MRSVLSIMVYYTTLFLDRDGVINEERSNDYVKTWKEFVFVPGALEALAILNKHFERIVIVTNQRGVGKGIMLRKALEDIHLQMLNRIEETGGRIDKIYTCIDTESSSPNRKPNSGMAWQAQNDFPDIVFEKSVLVGNSMSDMQFGKNLSMKTILVGEKYTREEKDLSLIDFYYKDLLSFARLL